MGTDRASGPVPSRGAEALSPEDATLLCATSPAAQLQIGALCRFEGGPLRDGDGRLREDDLRAHVAARLHLLPRFRQRLRRVPLDAARPVWTDDAPFDLDHHLRTAALDAPGGEDELRRFVARLLGRPLPPGRPLWDMWLVDGLAGGDVVVVLRVHRVVADGLSLLRAATALLDLEADPPPDPPPPPWRPREEPGDLPLLAGSLVDRRRHQLALAVGAGRWLLDPRHVATAAGAAVGAIGSPPRRAPSLPLTGPVGARRDLLWTSLPMEPLRAVARSAGATLNDVVLTLVTGALRRVVGEATAAGLAGRPPKALVPVGDTAGGDGGNAFSFVVADLPVHLDDPRRVLELVHAEMHLRKSSDQSSEMLPLFSVVDLVPVPLLRRLAPALLTRQPFVNLAVTNLPGSPVPLHLLGARLLELHPIVTGVGNIACIVGVLSYCDRLGVGITVDPDVVPDGADLLDALRRASTELLGGAPDPPAP